jgi:hypothetical protein
MQKPSLKSDVLQSNRAASSSSSQSNVLGIVPDDRTEGSQDSEDSSSSAYEFANKKSIGGSEEVNKPPVGDDTIFLEKEPIAGPKTLNLKEAPSDFASEFPDAKMPHSDFPLKKKAAILEEFEEENPPQNDDADLPLKKAAAGALDETDPNSNTSDSLSSAAALVQQQERNQRTEGDASNEVTYPGAVRVAGPEADSSDLEGQGTIMIGSDNTSEEINENNEEGLIHALIVDDVALVTAQPDPWWRRNQWWLAGSAAVVLGGIILAVVLTTVELSPSREALPTMAPTTVVEGIEANTERLIRSKFAGAEDALSDPSTPQSRALQWVTDRRIENEANYNDARVLQQYSLATLYYSTFGESAWNRSDGWLSKMNECEWYGVECSEEEGGSEDSGLVVGLKLTDNFLPA